MKKIPTKKIVLLIIVTFLLIVYLPFADSIVAYHKNPEYYFSTISNQKLVKMMEEGSPLTSNILYGFYDETLTEEVRFRGWAFNNLEPGNPALKEGYIILKGEKKNFISSTHFEWNEEAMEAYNGKYPEQHIAIRSIHPTVNIPEGEYQVCLYIKESNGTISSQETEKIFIKE